MIELNIGKRFISLLFSFLELVMFGLKKEVWFKINCIYTCISSYTLYYRSVLKPKRKRRALVEQTDRLRSV